MTTIIFRGAHFSYEPTQIATSTDSAALKYRSQTYTTRRAIAPLNPVKGLTYRGVRY